MKITSYSAGSFGIGTGTTVSGISDKSKSSAFRTQKTKGRIYKKGLNYNPREIRTALLRASKAVSAGKVLSTAKVKLSSLLKCKGTGQYEDSELNAAIIHARKMVRCAQLKARNLRKEEQMQHRFEKAAENDKKEQVLDKLERVEREKNRRLELTRKRRINRNEEKRKLDEADMEYKSRQLRNGTENRAEGFHNISVTMGDVELEISPEGAKLSEAQLEHLAEMLAESQMQGAAVSGSAAGLQMSMGTSAAGPEASMSGGVEMVL